MSHRRLVIVQEVDALLFWCVHVCVPAACRPDTMEPADFCNLTCITVLEHVSYAVANVSMTRFGHLRRLCESALISC